MKRLYLYRISCILFIFLSIFLLYKYETKKCVNINNIVNKNYVFVGDSITDFYDFDKYFDKKYPIVNSGINGNKVNEILNNMDERIYRYNPSDVIILVGINNYLYDDSTIKSITNAIEKIANKVHKKLPNCNIYIQSMYPINNKWKEKRNNNIPDQSVLNKKIVKTNNNLKKYCNEKGYIYINVFDSLKDKNGNLDNKYTNDGLHPNDKGYKVITKIIKKSVFEKEKLTNK